MHPHDGSSAVRGQISISSAVPTMSAPRTCSTRNRPQVDAVGPRRDGWEHILAPQPGCRHYLSPWLSARPQLRPQTSEISIKPLHTGPRGLDVLASIPLDAGTSPPLRKAKLKAVAR